MSGGIAFLFDNCADTQTNIGPRSSSKYLAGKVLGTAQKLLSRDDHVAWQGETTYSSAFIVDTQPYQRFGNPGLRKRVAEISTVEPRCSIELRIENFPGISARGIISPIGRIDAEAVLDNFRPLFGAYPHFDSIERRIQFLNQLSVDDDESPRINLKSLGGFLRFMLSERPAIKPSIFLNDNGAIRAQWRAAPRKTLFIDFRNDAETAFYVLTTFDPERPEDRIAVTSPSPVERISQYLEGYGFKAFINGA